MRYALRSALIRPTRGLLLFLFRAFTAFVAVHVQLENMNGYRST